jgi:uncharacterized protein YndB with AHSA1/START domain
MATSQPRPETSLQIRRMFTASRAKVFEAWTQKEKLEKWMCRDNPKNSPRYTAFDVRPGGTNRMEIGTADGKVYHQRITFREVKPPEKLVFTWAWERFSASGQKEEEQAQTLVTVEFHERGNWTELVLTHELFQTAEQRDRHSVGWNACFDVLARVLEPAQQRP